MREAVEEERALLVAAIAVAILEDPHAAGLEPLSGASPGTPSCHVTLPSDVASPSANG